MTVSAVWSGNCRRTDSRALREGGKAVVERLGPRGGLVQQARALARDRKERADSGLAVLEGVRLAQEALRSGVALEYALWSESLLARERGVALLEELRRARVPLHPCTPEALERAADTETPQGIIAVFRPPAWTFSDLGPGLVLVLDNLQDPGNLGTVVRTLEALGGGGAAVCGGVDPYNPKVVRGAMGSLFRLPLVRGELAETLAALRAAGRRIYVADAAGESLPWTVDLAAATALVVGNEGAGPSAESHAAADGSIRIPMAGRAESLNAGVAASLLVYEALRRRLTDA